MEEARPGLMSDGAQAGPGDIPTPAKGCRAVRSPTRGAPSTSRCSRHVRGKVRTAPGAGGESVTGGGDSNASCTAGKERLRLSLRFSEFYFLLS